MFRHTLLNISLTGLMLAVSTSVFAADATIHIAQFAFTPASIEVATGSKVTWVNDDKAVHSVISDVTGFSSEPLKQGEQFSTTFSTPGTYKYHCGFHAYMTGSVTVK
jgi:plastocyanin